MGHHCQRRVSMQPGPGAAREVVETELLLHLLAVCIGDQGSTVEGFQFMSANQADFSTTVMARVLGVSKVRYYAWAGW